jgi:hypothetical protein
MLSIEKINLAIAADIPDRLILSQECNKPNVISPVGLELLDHPLLGRKIIMGHKPPPKAKPGN